VRTGRDRELIEPEHNRGESEVGPSDATTVLTAPVAVAAPQNASAGTLVNGNGQRSRERKRRQAAGSLAPNAESPLSAMAVEETLDQAPESTVLHTPEPTKRSQRRQGERRPRAPRAEQGLAAPHRDEDASAPDASTTELDLPGAGDTPIIPVLGKRKRETRTVKRARRKQEDAAAALRATGDNPALGALNRHLNMMMQQLTAAHRIIGRVASERDALRQQLADLQGIPVEEVIVTAIGVSTEQPVKPSQPAQGTQPQAPSLMSRLNYFGGDDVAQMRRRRQRFVLGLVVFAVALWLTFNMLGLSMPDNLSRDSLGALPYIGNLMTIFLAGWLLFRVVRVSSKGVRWMFPSDDPRRRRR
jgi:hypothetical protein